MNEKVAILPLDGLESGFDVFAELDRLMSLSDMPSLVSHVKLNDGVHNYDFGGPNIVSAILEAVAAETLPPLKIFLDLKICDVSATLLNVLKKYPAPDILTVGARCSVDGIIKLRQLLPKTKLALVSVLTDIPKEECQFRFGKTPELEIYNDLMNIRHLYQEMIKGQNLSLTVEPFDLIVCSYYELAFLKKNLPLSYGFIVPGIRDEWMKKDNEHQKRIIGVRTALNGGATFVVMGAQLVKGNPDKGISPETSRSYTVAEVALAKDRYVVPGDPLATLKKCGGFYDCPQDIKGRPIGTLVAYAGTYDTPSGPKNKVGLTYYDFAYAEEKDEARDYFAALIANEIKVSGLDLDVVIGAPMGGILLSADVGRHLGKRTIYAEKNVTALADKAENKKEKSEPVIKRHHIYPENKVVVIEDVCNNFATTQKMKDLIESQGGELVGIACAFNRSGVNEWNGVPVFSALFIPTEQYTQEHPRVVKQIAKGKLSLDPKGDFELLKREMNNLLLKD